MLSILPEPITEAGMICSEGTTLFIRRSISLLVLFFGCWPLVAAELPLSPYPQKVQMGNGTFLENEAGGS